MAGNFASSTFSTGAQDSYRAVDVYSQNGKAPVTSYIERTIDTGSLSNIMGSMPSLGSINALSVAKNSVAYGKQILGSNSATGIMDRVMGSLGGIGASLKGASAGLQSSLLGKIGGTQNIYATVMGTVQQLKSGSLPDIRSVTNLINSVTGSSIVNLIDKNSIMGMASGLVSQATAMGIPKSFSALKSNLLSDPTMIAGVISSALPAVIKSSDVGTLKEFALADPVAVVAANPNVLTDFSFNYTSDAGTTQVAKMEQCKEIKETFTAIDPEWSSSTRNVTTPTGETVPTKTADISTVCSGSEDLKETFKADALNSTVPEDKVVLAASVAPTAPVREQLNTSFPDAMVGKIDASGTITVSPEKAAVGPVTTDYQERDTNGAIIMVTKTVQPDGSYTTVSKFSHFGVVDKTVTRTYDWTGKMVKIHSVG